MYNKIVSNTPHTVKKKIYSPDSTLILDLNFEIKDGSFIHDTSMYNNHGTLSGPTRASHQGRSTYVFDGLTDTIIKASGFNLSSAPYTVEAVLKVHDPAVVDNRHCLISFGDNTWPQINPSFRLTSLAAIYLNNSNYRTFSIDLNDNTYHHFVAIVTGNGQNDIDDAALYVDKINISPATTIKTDPTLTPDSLYQIGQRDFEGTIKTIKVYNRVLTLREIQEKARSHGF